MSKRAKSNGHDRDRRGVSMRTSLLLGFGSILLLTGLGVVFNNLVAARRVLRSLSTTILEQTTDLVETKIDSFFGTVSDLNTGLAQSFENGLLHWGDWDQFRKYVLPTLRQVPQIATAGAGDSEGNAFNFLRNGTNWISQEVRPADWGRRTLWKEWSYDGSLIREWWEESDYDPRGRPWFVGAVALPKVPVPANEPAHRAPTHFWTSPYRFFTTGDYGVTVAARVRSTNAADAVVFYDVRLADLDAFVVANAPSTNGFAVILDRNARVLGWPGVGDFARSKVLAGEGEVEVARQSLPVLADVMDYWRAQGEPAAMLERIRAMSEFYWVAMRAIPCGDTTFHVLVAVPRSDLLGEALKERQRMAVVLALGLLGSVGLAFWLAAVFTRPLAGLVQRSEAIERLDLSTHVEIASHVKEVQRLSSAQSSMAAALDSFGRYVPRGVIAELLQRGEAARIGAQPAELTILFSDIHRFTAISESMPPDDIARYLSEYFDALHAVIEQHQGTTDKFIGDAIMAFWGAPKPDPQNALHAVEAVLDCRAALDRLNAEWKAQGRPEYKTNFGLATGAVAVGNVGASRRLNYTVLGSTVNLSSRLVGLGRDLGCSILASESVAIATVGRIEWRRVGPVEVRGLSKLMMVCEPLGRAGEVPAEALDFKRRYERVLDAYLSRDFAAALNLISELSGEYGEEASVRYLLKRCEALAAQAEPEVDTNMLVFHKDAGATEIKHK